MDRAHHREVAGDSPEAQAVKVVARMHQSLSWDRTRQVLRLRSALREYFPAAIGAFDDFDAPDALELLAVAPDPDAAAKLTKARIVQALNLAGIAGQVAVLGVLNEQIEQLSAVVGAHLGSPPGR